MMITIRRQTATRRTTKTRTPQPASASSTTFIVPAPDPDPDPDSDPFIVEVRHDSLYFKETTHIHFMLDDEKIRLMSASSCARKKELPLSTTATTLPLTMTMKTMNDEE